MWVTFRVAYSELWHEKINLLVSPVVAVIVALVDWTEATIQVFSEKTTLKEFKIESNTCTLLIQIIELVNILLNNKFH